MPWPPRPRRRSCPTLAGETRSRRGNQRLKNACSLPPSPPCAAPRPRPSRERGRPSAGPLPPASAPSSGGRHLAGAGQRLSMNSLLGWTGACARTALTRSGVGVVDRKEEWLAARLEDLDYGFIDGIAAAVRQYPLEEGRGRAGARLLLTRSRPLAGSAMTWPVAACQARLPGPRQPGRVAWPGSGEGASRPRSRARATVSARWWVPSLVYRLRMWVLTVLAETYSSPAISGA